MKKTAFLGVVLTIGLMGTGALAQEGVEVTTDPGPAGGYNQFVVGGQISMGMATMVGDDDDAKPRFAGGGFAYFDFYVMEMLAIEAGLGFIGKGARYKEEEMGIEIEGKFMPIYMQIPIGVKLNIMNFRAAVLFAMDIGIGGKYKITEPQEDEEDIDWDDDGYRRFNIGPKIALGYAIPVGPIYIVPGLDWQIHILNDNDTDSADDYAIRMMNIMFNVAVEFGF